MRIRTDDEVYRVDAVWLGPPKATFPWRARYVAWGIGVLVLLVVLTVERQMGIGFDFFSTAWAVVITVALTTFICSRISHERPFASVLAMWVRELTAPRQTNSARGGAVSADRIRVHPQRPRPRRSGRSGRRPAGRGPSRGSARKKNKEVRRVRAPRR
ncbi:MULTISPECIES: hypothetical protein [Actinoalloteichus]|uniref:Uncharacterized protein n=1 Tax=Actinoalloteichus fjordicus TaxID=1612552 RepID=A0AAC9LHW8_9PSEU|nr:MULTISPECIES: hypothetical protein [Actinoalloteichus]APU17057.1 hypothetical protein UA74_25230 [Actinoalloteichus fjordicus]APU23138.1 hypothetical protein UA75_25815 [Actinoalloteichus sp. GBA129-24]